MSRFVSTSVATLKNKLASSTKEAQGEAEVLGKKLLYLETTRKNSQQHIDQLLKHNSAAS